MQMLRVHRSQGGRTLVTLQDTLLSWNMDFFLPLRDTVLQRSPTKSLKSPEICAAYSEYVKPMKMVCLCDGKKTTTLQSFTARNQPITPVRAPSAHVLCARRRFDRSESFKCFVRPPDSTCWDVYATLCLMCVFAPLWWHILFPDHSFYYFSSFSVSSLFDILPVTTEANPTDVSEATGVKPANAHLIVLWFIYFFWQQSGVCLPKVHHEKTFPLPKWGGGGKIKFWCLVFFVACSW